MFDLILLLVFFDIRIGLFLPIVPHLSFAENHQKDNKKEQSLEISYKRPARFSLEILDEVHSEIYGLP